MAAGWMGWMVVATAIAAGRDYSSQSAADLAIEFAGPASTRVDSPSRYRVRLINRSTAAIGPVELETRVPDYARVTASLPLPTIDGQLLRWTIDKVPAEGRAEVLFDAVVREARPLALDLAARITADLRVETSASAARLELRFDGPAAAALGKPVEGRLTIVNRGPAAVVNGGLKLELSAGLKLSQVIPLSREPFRIEPGGSLSVPLVLEATGAGTQGLRATAEADGNVRGRTEWRLAVQAPGLAVSLSGPRRQAVGMPADYVLTIENPGDDVAPGAIGFIELPENLELLSLDPAGIHDPVQRVVYWRLGNLSGRESRRLRVTVRGRSAGAAEVRGSVKDANERHAESIVVTRLEGAPAEGMPMTVLPASGRPAGTLMIRPKTTPSPRPDVATSHR